MSKLAELQLRIDAPDRDKNELEDLTRLLRKEIEQSDVESVQPISGGKVPKDAMAGEWYEIGVLSIKMATAVLPPLIMLINEWLKRQSPEKDKGAKGKTTREDLKVKLKIGKLSFEVNRSTSVRELAEDMRKQIEAER